MLCVCLLFLFLMLFSGPFLLQMFWSLGGCFVPSLDLCGVLLAVLSVCLSLWFCFVLRAFCVGSTQNLEPRGTPQCLNSGCGFVLAEGDVSVGVRPPNQTHRRLNGLSADSPISL
ncbi:hypothetical protein AMECASPLE_010895 [Ameca splendens]|uniref:Secreted protein n=1 Tax=Ameca splendens TaxID=208324 RepID=A0ABV0Y0J8_9TELE